jgi:hypothetical protein
MAPLAHSVEIDRSPEEVFAYVTDPSRFTEWQDAVVSARLEGSGPVQQGSRVLLTRRVGRRERRQAQKELPESHANLKRRLESTA